MKNFVHLIDVPKIIWLTATTKSLRIFPNCFYFMMHNKTWVLLLAVHKGRKLVVLYTNLTMSIM